MATMATISVATALTLGSRPRRAREKMTSQLTGELERLESLKAVNPNIREEELEYLRNQMRELTTYLDASQLQLDAIRMVLVSHV